MESLNSIAPDFVHATNAPMLDTWYDQTTQSRQIVLICKECKHKFDHVIPNTRRVDRQTKQSIMAGVCLDCLTLKEMSKCKLFQDAIEHINNLTKD
jgi:uncharacterized CHY-type Zn-finger protein